MSAKAVSSIQRGIGPGDLPVLYLNHWSGYRVTVSEYGAQVLSWSAPGNEELLFMSPSAMFMRGKAIRGGIPIVFPQFGKGNLPSHGFARTSDWELIREEVSDEGTVSVGLRLSSAGAFSESWPDKFALESEVRLSESLTSTLRISNTGLQPFSCHAALHTYFGVGDSARCAIEGLEGGSFVDFLRNRDVGLESSKVFRLVGPTDRAYRASPAVVLIRDPDRHRVFRIWKEGFNDTVVWNPWSEADVTLPDLALGSWRSMVCVESGSVLERMTVMPGTTHVAVQVLSLEQPMRNS